MSAARHCLPVFALLLLAGLPAARAQTDPQAAEDEKILRGVGAGVDGPELVAFVRKLTPTPADAERIKRLLGRLGDKTFRVREKAAAELVALGPTALPALRAARVGVDIETQRRADQCIHKIEQRHSPAAAAAAARLLKARRPADACAALLHYLPHAGPDSAEDVLEAVFSLGHAGGKVDPAVLAAVGDPAPARRAAAALVLGRHGAAEQRQAVRELLKDNDPAVRLRAAQGLMSGGDREALPALVALLETAPLPLAQQAEDLLARAAGERAPKAALGEGARERADCRRAWQAWWDGHKDKLDLAKADLQSPFADAAAVARKATRRFLDALLKGDVPTARKALDTPFVIDPIMVLKTRAEVDQIFLNAAQAPKDANAGYKLRKVVRLEEYARRSKKGVGRFDILKELPQPAEVRAVLVDARDRNRTQNIAVLVRVRGTRAWVVGLGILDLDKALGK